MKICMIGAGNLATQLSLTLFDKGHQVLQVFSQTEKRAKDLASALNCSFTTDPNDLVKNADLYIIAIKDQAIESFIQSGEWGSSLVVHTAGSISMDVFAANCKNYGVFYPFQTFSIDKRINFQNIPMCLEASSAENLKILTDLAATISDNIQIYNSEQRQQIHLASAFVCNFVNHLFAIGKDLVEEKGIDFEILKPLILETATKGVLKAPKSVQTGPAARKDYLVMDKHLAMLDQHPDLQKIYKQISERIIKSTIN